MAIIPPMTPRIVPMMNPPKSTKNPTIDPTRTMMPPMMTVAFLLMATRMVPTASTIGITNPKVAAIASIAVIASGPKNMPKTTPNSVPMTRTSKPMRI